MAPLDTCYNILSTNTCWEQRTGSTHVIFYSRQPQLYLHFWHRSRWRYYRVAIWGHKRWGQQLEVDVDTNTETQTAFRSTSFSSHNYFYNGMAVESTPWWGCGQLCEIAPFGRAWTVGYLSSREMEEQLWLRPFVKAGDDMEKGVLCRGGLVGV